MSYARPPFALLLLALMTFAAYWNAWPDALVLDDQVFAGHQRFADLSQIPAYFQQTVWGPLGDTTDSIYRPLLLVSLALDSALFPDRPDLWHLVNVVLHVLATLLLFLFLQQLLRRAGSEKETAILAALLAAAVFGVHPLHTEVVNSIFNRSVLFVAIGWLAGLAWLLRFVDARPVAAWTGIWLIYWFVLFSRETGILLPALAVTLVWVSSDGDWREKVRKCLPALTMAVPLIVYLALRARAIAAPVPLEPGAATDVLGVKELLTSRGLPEWEVVMRLAGVWFEALRLAVWPQPLLIDHPSPTLVKQIAGLLIHSSLVIAALYQYRRGRVGLISGLAIFYLALLPSSRLIGSEGDLPIVAERAFYEPSIGLAALLAFGLAVLRQRADRLLVVAPVLLALGLLTPLTWARNADWSDSIRLLEHDYQLGARSAVGLNALTARLVEKGDYARAMVVCRENEETRRATGMLHLNCGTAYLLSGDSRRAERAFLEAVKDEGIRARAHANLSRLYVSESRFDEALAQLELSIAAERDSATRAFRTGKMLMNLYPNDRSSLLDARSRFEEALRLRPGYAEAESALQQVDATLQRLR
jgi:hypothetical protein